MTVVASETVDTESTRTARLRASIARIGGPRFAPRTLTHDELVELDHALIRPGDPRWTPTVQAVLDAADQRPIG